ncbi:MAG: pyridoxal 5'-phosphate synthase glutaminase subunit PdxT [Planctomycetota bacterium]
MAASGIAANPCAGVLALQGDFALHLNALERRGIGSRAVRRPAQLEGLAGLVLPGGESSVMWRLIRSEGLEPALGSFVQSGKPVLGTCAGMILLAQEVVSPEQGCLGRLGITVERNGYGRQLCSAVYELSGQNGFPDCRGVFIRAPRILSIRAPVEVLATYQETPVLVRDGPVFASCFHPELSEGHALIDTFVDAVRSRAS